MPDDLLDELSQLAKRSGMSRNKYIRTVIESAAASELLTAERRHVVREAKPAVTYTAARKK